MTPRDFYDKVAHPNMMAALEAPDDLRAIVNAILSLDALAGLIHAHMPADARTDSEYREDLAAASRSFRVLRDVSASLKHGSLRHPKKTGLPRLLRDPSALQDVLNGLGLFRCGDEIGGAVIVIEFDPGPGYVRASDIIADSYRMLKRMVAGEPPSTDEHDLGTFLDDAADSNKSVS